MARYGETDVSFGGSREARLIEDLVAACEEGDEERFTQVVGEYDAMSRLDPWKTTMLLRVKRKLQGGAPAAGPGAGAGAGGGAAGAPAAMPEVHVDGDDLT